MTASERHRCEEDDELVHEIRLARLPDERSPIDVYIAPVRGLLRRYHPPEASVENWEADRTARNARVLESMRSSNGIALDESAYTKSLAEAKLGVLVGPFEVDQDLGLGRVCLVPRRGMWESHGGAVESSCRVIDDLLFGEQNSTVERFSSHRLTDVDGLAAQVRAVSH